MRSSKWADHRTEWKRDKAIDRESRNSHGYRGSRDSRSYRENRDSYSYKESGYREKDYKHGRERSRSRSPSRREGSPPSASEEPIEVEKPNYRQSGLLVKESKKTNGGKILKYHEPEDSTSPPKGKYRLYQFDAQGDVEDVFKLDQRSWYLIGRDEKLAHIPLVEIEAASGQHAALQFRLRIHTDKYGNKQEQVKLYVIDLESRNGTKLNGKDIPESRYVELRSSDVLNFGGSEDYVLMENE